MAEKKKPKKKNARSLSQLFVLLIVGAATVWLAVATRSRDIADAEKAEIKLEQRLDKEKAERPSTQSLTEVITNPAQQDLPVFYKGMNLSFNPAEHVPNWVAWELTADETQGDVPRYNKFLQDASVEGCPLPADYTNSGYSRGHMAPAGDMKWDEEAMKETFFMTNICPQANSLNSGAWLRLEEKCRQWAQADGSVIIICGPVLTDSLRGHIGETGVAVPDRFFKVILSPDAQPIRGIGFIMTNGSVPGGMQKAAVSIREVERVTGHDFFSVLPDSIEDIVENQCDFPFWSTLK
ncbi:MAG: DNA/RNA non-specific endonuclease [Paramuribaculum sp.]|nr:DNA/RNA non-specific endonuclease [Paramuribaculum sp.]